MRSGHQSRPPVRPPPRTQIEAAAEMFRALGDPERLRLLVRLAAGEACVSELAEDEGMKITTVSARLKTLFAARLVKRRREAKHVSCALADEHLPPVLSNAIDHAAERRTAVSADLAHGKEITPSRPARRPIPTMLTSTGRIVATLPSATAVTSIICTTVTCTIRTKDMSMST